ncbi:MAG TPA: SAM-dependent methyltransferase [Actinomycetes bacterium]
MSKTALAVARVRAEESRRPDRLFDDPYAEAFLAAVPGAGDGRQAAAAERGSLAAFLRFHTVIRTRFYDDYLLGACAGGLRQVVLPAAGLDTRAFRLAWPDGVRLFELDLPQVLDFKRRVLAGQGAEPRCDRTAVAADLREDWPGRLTGAGFRSGEPTAWLVEGLLVYLTADEAARVLTGIGELSATASWLAFERGDAASLPRARAGESPAMERLLSLWKGGLGQDPPGWLARHGWQAETHELAAIAASYGRPAPDRARSGFVTATYHAGGAS